MDPLVFGHRLRHYRKARGLTLEQLGALIGRPAPYLSMVENGKREARLSLIGEVAHALDVSVAELLEGEAPTRRARLEIALERAQEEPLYQALALPYLKPGARVPDDVLDHIVTLYDALRLSSSVRAESQEEVRLANARLLADARQSGNHRAATEAAAAEALKAAGYTGSGAVSPRHLLDLCAHFGFTVEQASDLPRAVRSITDLRTGRIFIPPRDALRTRAARSVVLQTLARFALDHPRPSNFAEFLEQRVEASYFASAVLIPEESAAAFLAEAHRARDLAVEDLKELFYVSYEMAAHRFTNLATEHLGLPTHFIRADREGVIWKAYENDGLPLPGDAEGGVEGQILCRHFGARAVFGSPEVFGIHYQYTDTPAGTFWCSTHVPADRTPHHAITLGTDFDHARHFRGRDTERHAVSRCPDGDCCRRPPAELAARWGEAVWASTRAQSHVITALTASPVPEIDLTEVYEFMEHHPPE